MIHRWFLSSVGRRTLVSMDIGKNHMRRKGDHAVHAAAWLCATAWLCAACACSLEPRYRTPVLPVPDQWPLPATTPERPAVYGPARDIGWRDFFIDAQLGQLIGLALANNRDLRVAVLNIEQ